MKTSPPSVLSLTAHLTLLGVYLVLAGCSGSDTPPAGEVGTDISPVVQEAAQQQTGLLAEDAGSGILTTKLADLRKLRGGLYRTATRKATQDSILFLLERDPGDPAVLELVLTERRRLGNAARVEELLELAAGPDTAAAPYLYVRARGRLAKDPEGARADLQQAAALVESDTTLQAFYVNQRLAYVLRRVGENEAGIERLARLVPLAWSLGGAELAGKTWYDLNFAALRAERLGEALLAVEMAEKCAVHCDNRGQLFLALTGKGQVYQARRQFALADSVFHESLRDATERDSRRGRRKALALLAGLAFVRADLEAEISAYEQNFALNTEVRDTVAAIVDAAAMGDALRRAGRLDEAEEWFQRGYALADAFSGEDQHWRIDSNRAVSLSQLGLYAEAETLLVNYGKSPGAKRRPLSNFGVQITLLEQGLENDRPDLAYHALARAEELVELTPATREYDPLLELRLRSARLHARQGEFSLADRDLAVVTERAVGASNENAWFVAEARALVAELAGDRETAEEQWRFSLALADSMEWPDLQARSRVRLAGNLMAGGKPEEAALLVAENLEVPEYWIRLNATMITGMSHVRSGEYREALEVFARAESLLGEAAPADLEARLGLEMGQAFAALNRHQEAWSALQRARGALERGRQESRTDLGITFNENIEREVAESMLAVLHRNERLAGKALMATSREIAAWGRGARVARWSGPSLEFFVGEDNAFVWSGEVGGNWSWRALPDPEKLTGLLRDVMVDTSYPDRPVDRQALLALSQVLLEDLPGSAGLEATLGLVPDGPLHSLPWAALPVPGVEGKSLLESSLLSHCTLALLGSPADPGADASPPVSGAASGSEAREYEQTTGGRLLVLASDARAESDAPRLLQAEAEGRAVARLWPADRVTLRLQEQGDLKRELSRGLSGYQAIHISSHTRIYEGASGHSAIHLAGTEGVLTLEELSRARIDTDLVFLSSCEGGLQHRVAGQGMTSFALAFVQAGARRVIASQVLVEDEAGRQVAEGFYRRWLQGTEKAAALRAALLDLPGMDPSWAHPFYWGFYQLHAPGAGS
jgi:tetratricopeptide (TPR) repeat protein